MSLDSSYTSTAPCATNPLVSYLIDQLPVGEILNVGAGYGMNPLSASHEVVNVDIDPRVLRSDLNPATPVAADVGRLPFRSGAFKGILLKDVLEHVADPIGAMIEARRVAADHAVITIIVPRAIPRKVWDDPTHLRGFTKKALSTVLDLTGWEPVGSIGRIGSLPGAGRFDFMMRNIATIMKIPVFGHLMGPNWIVSASARPGHCS